jgi:hypothetical protein
MAVSLHMNATATWNSSAFSEVTGVDVSKDGELVQHSAGVDSYVTFQALVKQKRTVTVHTDSAATTLNRTPGAAAQSLSCVLKGAGGTSDLTISGSFMIVKVSGGASHASVEHGQSCEFSAVSSDGTTDPMSVA